MGINHGITQPKPGRTVQVFLRILLVLVLAVDIAVPTHDDIRAGWLLFKETGVGGRTSDEWLDPIYSNNVDLDIYAWDLEYMLDITTTFRSPLMEYWSNMDMQQVIFVLFNADAEPLEAFAFNLAGTSANLFTFYNYSQNMANAIAFTKPDYGVSITISTDTVPYKFILNVLSVYGAAKISDKFILSTGYSGDVFASLPSPVYEGCYKSSGDFAGTEVHHLLDCTHYCLSSEYDYIGLHSQRNGTQNTTYCGCLSTITPNTLQSCDHYCGNSSNLCGELVDVISSQGDPFGISVYAISNIRQNLEKASDMSELTGWNDYLFSPTADTGYSVYLGHIHYIREMAVLDTIQQNFTLGYTTSNCTSYYFELSMYDYYGEATSKVEVFQSDSIVVLEPIPVMCLRINFTESPIDRTYILKLRSIRSDFVMAQYLGVWGSWLNSECTFLESMQYSSIIPDSAISVEYTQPIDLTSTSGRINMTQSSVAIIDIGFPVGSLVDFWIRNITVYASYPVNIHSKVHTSTNCTSQSDGLQQMVYINESFTSTASSGGTSNLTFTTIKPTGLHVFCGHKIKLRVQTPAINLTDPNYQYFVNVSVYGCVLSKGNVNTGYCIPENLIVTTGLDGYMTSLLEPISEAACPALRPIGTGLLIFPSMEPSVRIELSTKHDTVVQSITVKGDGNLSSAHFLFGDSFGVQTRDSIGNLVFQAGNGRGRFIVINQFMTDNMLVPSLVQIVVVLCTNHFGYFTTANPSGATNTSFTNSSAPTPPTTVNTTTLSSLNASTSITSTATNATKLSSTITSTTKPTTASTHANGTTLSSLATSTQKASTLASGTTLSSLATSTQTPSTLASGTTLSSLATSTQIPSTLASGTTLSSLAASTLTSAASTSSGVHTRTRFCCCNITAAELDAIVRDIIFRLTIPKKDISAYKRKLISAPDNRPSATYVGSTCGIVAVSLCSAFIVFMDFSYFRGAFNIVTSLLR